MNEKQRQAASFKNGIALVLAVPGSGKTRTMTERIAMLVRDHCVPPTNILGLTFTRNAAEEMKERLAAILGPTAKGVCLSTIHGFCLRLLKQNGYRFEILCGARQLAMLEDILSDLGIRDGSPGALRHEIGLAKNNMIRPDEFGDLFHGNETGQVIARAYGEYEARKHDSGFLDLDDLLLETVGLLSQAAPHSRYKALYRHVLVDEYQDTNPAQFAVLQALVQGNGDTSFWACGDDWQSIYAFNGASLDTILGFQDRFPTARTFRLDVNYRSTPQILAAAVNLIGHNRKKVQKDLIPHLPDGPGIGLIEASDEMDEALRVANEIKTLVERGEATLDEIAVLYRANFQSRFLEDAFVDQAVPYRIENGASFYHRREVRPLIDYLSLILDPYAKDNDSALTRIINRPNRYIGRSFMTQLKGLATRKRTSLFEILADGSVGSGFQKKNINRLVESILSLHSEMDKTSPEELLTTLRRMLDYDRWVAKNDIPSPDDLRVSHVDMLAMSIQRFDSLESFLRHVDAFKDDEAKHEKHGVSLMTIHKSKGKEFPIVFIVGLVENILPSSKNNIDEERRICFVGMTRAMRKLYVGYSHSYMNQPALKSSFISESEII